ncbi:hypothetical protein C0J52_08074 [Blattella germanica]|nr:hypothetical protein C0J52_08074 [Blattella germanica]
MEDEGRQRKLEAGKEKFAAYLKKKNASGYQSEQKKKKKIESETEDVSADRESSPSIHHAKAMEPVLLLMMGNLLARKEMFLMEGCVQELKNWKIFFQLQEFQEAVQDRERIIGQLSGSLKQAIETRDALQLQGDHLAQEVALLQNQLKATIESIQSHQWDTGIKPHDYLALQNQMLALKATVSKNESIIEDLRNIVKERDMMLLGKSDELEKKTQELSQHKTKSANEIQKLMREVEELHQRCAMQTSNQNSLIVEHEGQLASLHSEMEENFGLQLFNEERGRMEKEHAEEMTSYKALLVKLTEMSSRSEVDLVTSANEQLDLILTQLQNTLEAKELLEKEIAELKDSHKVQVNTLQCNISKLQKELEEMVNIKQNFEQNILEMRNYYEGELSSYKKQVENLNFQLQEASKAEANLSSQVLKYETELASCRQSYEMELSSLRQRMEALNLRLQEASEAEENFPKVLAAHKHSLESELTRYKEENELLNAEIQTGKMMIDALHKEKIEVQEFQKIATSYEEQSQNLRTSLKTTEETAARLQSETISLKLQLEETNKTAEEYVKEMASYKERISVLNVQLEKVENENRTLKEDLICCKEAHQQEIILLKQKFDLELNERASNIKCHSHEEELASCKQQIEFLNSRLQDANDAEKCHVSEINTCQVQLREYKEQVESLDKQFNELINAQERHSKEVSSKNQEIETLQECVLEASKMGEQYKNEQISLQSEIENLNKQLKERMETEKQHAAEMASYKEKLIAYSDQVEALKKLANTQDELEAYKLQVETLRESLQCEVSRLKSIHSTEIKEKEEHHALEMLSLKKKLEDLTSQLAEVNTARESLEKEKNVKHETHISEIAVYQQQLEELNVQIQKFSRNEEKYIEELTQYQTQLTSNKNIIESLYAKLQEETSQLKEVHLRELDEYKNKVQNLESERTRLEAAVADAVKQKEDTTNLNRAQLEEITIQYLKLQTLLAARDEVEESLEKRIKDLQSELNLANETITQMKQENDQLQEMTVQYLKLEGVLAGRDEMMKALTDQNQQLQETLDNVTKNLEESNKECTLLTQRVAKAKELLRRLKAEKDELAEKCKQLETDKAELSYRLHEGQLRDVAAEIITLENNQGLPIEDACSTKVVAPLESAAVVSPNSSNEQTVITIENSESNHNVNCSQIPESGPLKRRKRELAEIEEPVSSCLPQKWVDKLIAVEDEKTDLANKLELLESKLKEKELQEDIYIKETNTINLHCKELEEKLLELGKYKTQLDIVLQEKSDLELQIRNLKSENTTFHNFQEALNNELAEERISRENKIHNDLKEKYANIINEKNAESMEQLIIDLDGKAKENIFLQEKMRIQEQAYQSLQKKVLQFEECKDLDAEKLQICKNELERVRNELEESWKLHQATKDELGNLKKEFAMLQFHKQQLESSRTSSIHAVMEELASEVEALKSSLEFEQHRNEKLALELEVARNNSATDVNSNNNGTGMLELQHKLELILKSNTELQAGGYEQVESWMSNLDKQQTDLMVELRAYREQHTSLAELVGSTGVLQETLYIQKQEVLRKLQALTRQKRLLEQDLHAIEDRLRDQEDILESQKQSLEAEIHARDLHIQHWKLELRRKQAEINTEQIMKTFDQEAKKCTKESENENTESEQRLELWRSQVDEIHQQAVARLKHHLGEQFSAKEAELKRNFSAEVATLEQQHKEQQKEIYSVMKQKFEKFAEEQIVLALNVLQEEHNSVHQQEVNSLIQKHTEELKVLQTKLEKQRQEELMLLRQSYVHNWFVKCQEHFEIINKQIESLQDEIIKCHVEALQKLETQFETEHSKLKESIENMNKTVQEGATIANLQEQITVLEEEKKDIEIKHRHKSGITLICHMVDDGLKLFTALQCNIEITNEIQIDKKTLCIAAHFINLFLFVDVANLRQELEAKHAKEMEELRRYFEQKCADLEKHYSEEVFSQHSRKMSGSSSGSEEMVSDMYYAGGDHGQRLTALTHICDSYTVEPNFEKRLIEYRDQLDTVKQELEQKYRHEMELLREEYESKVQELVMDLSNTHKTEIQNLESKHEKEMMNLKEKFQTESAAELSNVKLECAGEVEKVDMEHKIQMDLKQHFEEEHKKQMEEVIIEIQNKHAKELEAERKVLAEQFDEVTSMLKRSSEEEQEKFLQNQKEMVSNLMKQHQKDLQTLKMQLEEECKRLCREKVHQVKEKYEKENRLLKEELSKLTANRDTCKVQLLSMATKPVESTTKGNKTEQIQQLQQEIKEKDDKLAEMKELHENELQQVRILCEGRLHDEVEQAKHDIVSALEEQIQALLANDSEDTQWPQELVELQEKFSARYKQELEQLKAEHAKQIAHLKDESDSELQSLSEKYNQLEEQHKLEKTKHDMQMKLGDLKDGGEVDAISILHADLEHLIKERDGLRKMSSTLRYLLGELVAYFTVCEDELNNTLIGELLKIESDVSPSGAETSKNNSTLADQGISSNVDRNDTKSSDSSGRKSDSSIKTGDTFSIESPVTSLNDADISVAAEQATCEDISMVSQSMEKSLVPATPRSASRRVHFAPDTSGIIGLIEEDKLLDYIEKNKDLSTDFRSELEHCLERLKEEASAVLGLSGALPRTVQITREAVASLEEKVNILTSRLEKEVKSKDELLIELQKFQETEKEATQLQEQFYGLEMDLRLARARVAELERELGKREDISEGFGESIQPGLVDAADKQLRATRQFLEDQAAEREQERDDFLREIAKLQELLRERDRDRSEHQQLSKEVEALELQVKEAAALQKESDHKKEELETELKAAVDKIWVLRDIICELESQVETKTQHETTLEQQLQELHAILEQQSQNHQELAEELDSLRVDSGKSELTEHINHLEEQLRKHRLHVEQFQSNSTAVKQMKAQAAVDKKTKDLESFHANVSSGSCSSPSEDVSVREHLDSFRCDTPESQSQSPVCLPLDELHRLQDKLQRHSRAEEVALKRIRDLEMQLKGVKRNEEEVTAERDVLQERMEEQLLKISALQSRLDEQRRKADGLLKEANMELQTKVRDQDIELNKLREMVENKDKEVKELKDTLIETRRVMAAQESEWNANTRAEVETAEKLRELCRSLNLDISALQRKLNFMKRK